ncbi:CcdB family protein [Albibacillus kandeliae]|uniref:CcdB family protein n=1 Tax=Albibacillus kandeliae TaxID=2174228 RepID=UPI000D68FCF1|nr:CcdB family protein [Albibacillus kandeliae]
MAQFHVYRLPDGTLVLDLQSDLIRTGTRVVAPLLPVTEDLRPITRLEPVFHIEGEPMALHTGEMAAIPERLVSSGPVMDLTSEDYTIRRALDLVFVGF